VATLSHSDLMLLWEVHGGTTQSADVAAAIAEAESGGCQYAKHGPTDDRPVKECTYTFSTGENSYGLWQINRQAHPQYGAASLYTTGGNAAAAVAIANGGASFSAWSTYTNGAYKRFLTGTVSTVPQQGGTFATPAGAVAAGTHRGYADAKNSLGRHLPTQLERSRRTNAATMRLLGARHRAGR
jgi:Lysozyme like domain